MRAELDAGHDVSEQVLAVLRRHVSTATARSILSIAAPHAASAGGALERAQLRDVRDGIARGLRLFLDPKRVDECLAAFDALAGGKAAPAELRAVVPIRREDDIVRARSTARDLAVKLGFSVIAQTRLATAVSELARNVVQYAGADGEVAITVVAPPGLDIVVTDRGPGIPNLDRILAGDYRSKLGLGLGLRGVKQIADRFEIDTRAGGGTTVKLLFRAK
jgi:serine/threonine-protein kinase RsbT